ncbi:MAG TPA: aspartate carbamoyltransferase regulatory subunit [Verrucomicrobiae bacterium]|nr:aspartate carbamoyltransferase regulatory subunit [Verrucomicrobiae bacterium]
MPDSSQLLVRRIKNGTVIDHIESPRALLVLDILNINGHEGNVITVALNVPSIKHKKKDIIKVENKFLEKKETDKLALIAPKATINIIKNYNLIEKRKIQLPDKIIGFFKCPNLKCITNTEDGLKSKIEIIDKVYLRLKCQYCARSIITDELINYK